MDFPDLPMDFSTITDPMTGDVKKFVGKLWTDWGNVRLKKLKLSNSGFEKVTNSLESPYALISPVFITGRIWMKRGPNGKGLVSKIIDIVNVRRNTEHIYNLDLLGKSLYTLPG